MWPLLSLTLAAPLHLSFDWRPGDRAVVRAVLEADGPGRGAAEDEWELEVYSPTPGTYELRVLDLDGQPRLPPEWIPGNLTFAPDGRLRSPVRDGERASASLWFAWVGRWVGTDRDIGEERVDRVSVASSALGWRSVPTSLQETLDGIHPCGRRRKPQCAELALTVLPDDAEVTASFTALRAAYPEVGAATVDRAAAAETWSIATEVDTLRPQAVIGTRTVLVWTSDGGHATREVTVRYSFTWARRK